MIGRFLLDTNIVNDDFGLRISNCELSRALTVFTTLNFGRKQLQISR
jgi:hypothetical protein